MELSTAFISIVDEDVSSPEAQVPVHPSANAMYTLPSKSM